MLKTLKNAWKVAELRKKLLFTAFILIIFRLGCVIPVPYFNSLALSEAFEGASFFQYLNILSGQAFSQGTVFALSVSPYITAQIIMQLLTIAIPALERIAKEGDEGRRKIESWTRIGTVILAVITAYGYYVWVKSVGALTDTGFFAGLVIVSTYTAGAALVMWLAEKINEHGIGNGISMILFANIIASFPVMIWGIVAPEGRSVLWIIIAAVITAIVVVAVVGFIVFVTESERRIPVQYAKKVVGRKMYGGQNSSLPIKLNMSGVMPIIFAQSIVSIPSTLDLIFKPGDGIFKSILNFFTNEIFYAILLFILIIAFAYFYLAISFNPVEVANNIKNNGGMVLGIRPGKPTAEYISKILSRITLIGAIFLGLIAMLPMLLSLIPGVSGIAFGGTSILIVVGVALETTRDLESQLMMRNYSGFLN
ncbi:MAG: preprotein translocase subunit SecY [Ruminococcaceae bacterium]|nr:preprotein translocase subunit SecY [Oscillospiraceae bacterium]